MTMSIGPKAHRVKFLTAFHRVSCTHTPSKSAFTTAAKALNQVRPSKQISRPSIVARAPPPQHLAPATTILRYASTAPAAPNQNQPSTSEEVLTWDRFFDLRRKRRYLNLGSSVITASTAIGIFGPLIAQQDIDGWAAQISGIDPIIVLGITTFATAAGGWLCGPSFGTAMFKVWAGRKGWNQAIQEKETSFFARVKRYRADPSSSSPQNPIPDYYGEKIGSVKDYRRWLKDQRAFNLKKNKNMI